MDDTKLVLSQYTVQEVGKWVRNFRIRHRLSTFALASKIEVSPILVELVEHSSAEDHNKLIELLPIQEVESLLHRIQTTYDLQRECICSMAAMNEHDQAIQQHEVTFFLPFTLTDDLIISLMNQALQLSFAEIPYREQRDTILKNSVTTACLLIKLLRSHLIQKGCEQEAQTCADKFSQTLQHWLRCMN